MRTAVVGATGNVGSRLVSVLASDPAIEGVVAIARRRPESLPPGVEWREADLAAPLPEGLLAGVEAVVHLAWLFQPSHAPAITWNANVRGTLRLLDAIRRSGVRVLVHASSVGAYSPRQSEEPVSEDWPTHGVPTSAYSVEKAYVERLLDVVEERRPDLRVVRMRPAFIFREESAVQQRRLFLGPFAPTRTLTRLGLPVLPDPGGLSLQVVHTDDVAAAYLAALLGEHRGAFNLAAEPVLDMAAVAAQLGARVVKVPAGLTRAVVRAAWSAHLVPASPGMFDLVQQIPLLDSGRARRELAWQPAYDAHATLAELLAGMRRPVGAPTPPLDPATSGPMRSHELATGLGVRP